ncbi:hypothetical protein ACH4TQ_27410 [Streptomyces sp. NPDC021218]|uniref:hypothetical protein n=1 Tax=Streptomyces sp. NPDC021218 TaxID=3365119 RepID=UPI0037B26E78
MTTDQPYTDADLRAEATRQHAFLTEDPDFMGVGEAMEDAEVESLAPEHTARDIDGQPNDADGVTWGQLLPYNHDDGNAYNVAQREIHNLINGAANTSEWAVNLGADGLKPDEHQLTWSTGPQPIVRVHFAFHDGMSDEARDYLVQAVGEALGGVMDTAAHGAKPTD